MKARLLHRDHDVDFSVPFDEGAAVVEDLGLRTVLSAMADDDRFLYEVAARVLLASLHDPEEIRYRQQILADCLTNASVVREVYGIAVEALTKERAIYRPAFSHPSGILRRSAEVLWAFVTSLRRLRQVADAHAATFSSEGWRRFFAMVETELTDSYFAEIEEHLGQLRFKGGVSMSAQLGPANKGTSYTLRAHPAKRRAIREVIGIGEKTEYSFHLAPRDEAGAKALAELADRGLDLAASALAQSAEHVLSFFSVLCHELGFYVGCLNLAERLAKSGEPTCLPEVSPARATVLHFAGLYDVALALDNGGRAVGNDVDADHRSLIMITGANSGGKSTLLRGIGLAQLMAQAGMFVGAVSFASSLCRGLFTHFLREEDSTMTSGKLDEELARMSALAGELSAGSLVLFNESFAATNEREGSEIARQIVTALREREIRVIFVTHLYELAASFAARDDDAALFLRAQREADGTRTFKLEVGEPLPTSYGEDLYAKIGGW